MAVIPCKPPFFPIVYVRGYAGTQQDVEDTVADPFMGFNLGSSKIRQQWTGKVQRFYFESPLVRLMKDKHLQYRDTYHGEDSMPLPEDANPRSVFIYRYYDVTSSDFGPGHRSSIEEAALGLSELILKIRDALCQGDAAAKTAFGVHLVAHSMGGLICRCFLQNLNCGHPDARAAVDKVFTYATPHNGIDFETIGNIPGFVSMNDSRNFNRVRMREYLNLPDGVAEGDVSSLDGKFDPDRFFNLVGTNDGDYEVASGWSRRLVGPMSDGLVRIVNATTAGPPVGSPSGTPPSIESPRAFAHRSHSGSYGIVNSEEGFQNLKRFLFGDVRVTGVLKVSELTLPAEIQQLKNSGKKVRASYQFEAVVRVRGQTWDLHRRTVGENSAIFRLYDDLFPGNTGAKPRSPTLFSVFLSARERVDPADPSLGFCVDLGVVVPQYEVDGVLWFKDHYEGGYLFRHKINVEATPSTARTPWLVKYGFDLNTPNDATEVAALAPTADGTGVSFAIPVVQRTQPGIVASLQVLAMQWNS